MDFSDSPQSLKWNKLDWQVLALTAAVAFAVFMCGLGSFGILDPSDGYYAEGAREMLESGDYIVPHLNYAPWYDKPILTYWLIALSYRILGVHEFAARLPSAICAAALVALSYLFGRQFLRRRSSLLSALVLVSTPMWLILGHLSLTDMPFSVTLWIASGCLITGSSRQKEEKEKEKEKDLLLWVGYFFAGLALLCKGPLGLFLIGLNLAIYLAISRRDFRQSILGALKMRPLMGALMVFSVAAPWYIAVTRASHGRFIQEFFFNANLRHAMGLVSHPNGVLYYIPFVLGGFFPWSIISVVIIAASLRKKSVPLRARLRRWRAHDRRSALTRFSAISTIAILLFFWSVPAKLSTYLLPAVPPLSFVVGTFLDRAVRCRSKTLAAWLGSLAATQGLIALMLVCVTAISSLVKPEQIANLKVFNMVKPLVTNQFYLPIALAAGLLSCSFIYAAVALSRSANRRAITALVAGTAISAAVATPFELQLVYDLKCKDFNILLATAEAEGLHPAVVAYRKPSAPFYCRHPVRLLPDVFAVLNFLQSHTRPQLLLVNSDGMKFLSHLSEYDLEIQDSRGYWTLVVASKKSK